MHTFFHGWRRKAGCLTLALMGLDLRSRLVCDTLHSSVGESADLYVVQYLESYDGRIAWFHGNYEKRTDHRESLESSKWQSNSPSISRNNGILLKDGKVLEDDKIKWSWGCCGFGFGTIPQESDAPPGSTVTWSVTYLSAVIPLTLLSAYLILAPSRKRPPAESQPHA